VRKIHWILSISIGAAWLLGGCAWPDLNEVGWKVAVDKQVAQLGNRNWIIIAEASFPAYNRIGVRQVNAEVEIPEALDYVLNVMERTENTRPNVYLARELRSVKNDYAPGIDSLRKSITDSLHGHEAIQIDHQSLQLLIEGANRNFDVLVIRTQTALPYSSVYLELLPGYWDADSEEKLREQIENERRRKISPPMP